MTRSTAIELGGKNLVAFQDCIARSELGPLLELSDDGYNVIVGSTPGNLILTSNYLVHPRQLITIKNKKGEPVMIDGKPLKSTAAGRYQFIAPTWDALCAQNRALKDFSPKSQDIACVMLIRGRGALDDVMAGRFALAINKCRKEWASLPGAGYKQHEHTLSHLQAAYLKAGGVLA
jgi:muramidase (phage lysozyme)